MKTAPFRKKWETLNVGRDFFFSRFFFSPLLPHWCVYRRPDSLSWDFCAGVVKLEHHLHEKLQVRFFFPSLFLSLNPPFIPFTPLNDLFFFPFPFVFFLNAVPFLMFSLEKYYFSHWRRVLPQPTWKMPKELLQNLLSFI